MSRAASLGSRDPRHRRAAQQQLTDMDLAAPLYLDKRTGQIKIRLGADMEITPDNRLNKRAT